MVITWAKREIGKGMALSFIRIAVSYEGGKLSTHRKKD